MTTATLSLKEQRAAQKAAKKLKKIQRDAKKTAPPPQKSWVHDKNAKKNREKMIYSDYYGAPPPNEEREAQWQENEIAWEELVYCRNVHDNTGRFEKMLRNARVLYSLFDYDGYSYFVDVFQAAENALRQEFHSRDLSPNQRRAILKPLQDLNDVIFGLMKETPQQVLYNVAKYGTGVQIQAYSLAFWEQGDTATLATFNVIEGKSINQIAKEYRVKVNVLREKVLYCARCLYRVAECDSESTEMSYPSSITELRSKAWQKWGDGSALLKAYFFAQHHLIAPFETHTGKGMTSGYDKRFQAIRNRIFSPNEVFDFQAA